MVTALDSNIFFDLLSRNSPFEQQSRHALRLVSRDGPVNMSAVCYAEIAQSFPDSTTLASSLDELEISVSLIDQEIAFLAGTFFRDYKRRGGARTRILPDFLIAAHAQLRADRILTRDARFFGESFPGLRAIAPDRL